MRGRLPVLIVITASAAFLAGMVIANVIPSPSRWIPAISLPAGDDRAEAQRSADSPGRRAATEPADDEPGAIRLSDSETEAAGIAVAAVQGGTIVRRIVVPGTIVPHADRIAHVAVRLSGTLAELRKKIGDPVASGEVLAVLESREVADAKSDYLAARLSNELQQDLFERDKALLAARALSEQQLMRSRNQAAQAKIKLDIARQKLAALGVSDDEIAGLPTEAEGLLRRQEIRSPMAGRVVERKVDLGMAVGRDNLETELFVVADLGTVWVDLAVSPSDLPAIREGQDVVIASRSVEEKARGRVIFISPLLDKDTRTARVVAEIDNADGRWRPGSFVSASIATGEQAAKVVVPVAAVQSIGGEKVVFVRTPDGFRKRPILVGRTDERLVEVAGGLQDGETVAVNNTFLLKSELTKGAAED